jgi:polar amino acid transport system substrate-binding protein
VRRSTISGAVVLAAVALAGCGGSQDQPQLAALAALGLKSPHPRSSKREPTVKCARMTASLRPPSTLPTPGAMPAGSFMARIEHQGYLLAGVNAGDLKFGYLNPFDNHIEGFEIGLAQALANRIFGNRPGNLRLRALTTGERIPAVQQGGVDVVVDDFTITCYRRTQVDFSTVYYNDSQRVLVPTGSTARGLQDLGGKRVCTPAAGSAPYNVIVNYPSHPIAAPAAQSIDCLVELQEGRVDAISTDGSVLLGFRAQDPYTKLVGPPLATVSYGMAVSKRYPEFVRFVNGVLAQMRADGAWRALYRHWLGGPVPAPPPAQYDG